MKTVAVLILLSAMAAVTVVAADIPEALKEAGLIEKGGEGISFANGRAVFTSSGNSSRSYLRSGPKDLSRQNIQFEATVTLRGGGGPGCAFVGLGVGKGNPELFMEPSMAPVAYLRMAPNDFGQGRASAGTDGIHVETSGKGIGDGTHRVRMTWDKKKKQVLFEIDKHWDGKAFIPDTALTVSAKKLTFTADSSRIFVGGSGNVSFANVESGTVTAEQIAELPFSESIAGDATAGTWLPLDAHRSADPEIDKFLKSLDARMRLLFCRYEGPKLAARRNFDGAELKAFGATWRSEIKTETVSGKPDALDIDISFTLEKGFAPEAGVAVAFDFENWSKENYLLLPSSVYDANRCMLVDRGYAKGVDRKYLYKKGLPLMSVPIPQLSFEADAPSRLEVSTSNMATPAVCIYSPKSERGFILLTEQGHPTQSRTIDNGFIVEENKDRSRATVVVSSPGVRSKKPLFIGFTGSSDRGMHLKAGDTFNIKMRLYSFDASGIPALLDKFMTVRKDVTGQNTPRELVPFSQVIKYMAGRIDSRWSREGRGKFYAPENAPWISFGWVGGLMNTHPMLALGDAGHFDRVSKTFDFAMPQGQGKSGLFYSVLLENGRPSCRDGYADYPHFVLTRKNGDVIYWMIKQFELLKAQGKADKIKPAWEANVRRAADALVKIWKEEGEWGRILDANTGKIAEYNTTSGAIVCGALALASDYYDNPEYLEVAKESAQFFYQRDFVKSGQTTGGVGDTLQNSDSESAAGFMMSLMALYEVTGDTHWLEKSRNLANLVATWTTSFDYRLPGHTELARRGARLTGVHWASTQNKHGAPGICTSAGEALFKIYRATGDRRYAELMRDIVRCHAESIRPDGKTNERLTYCDAEPASVGTRGTHVTGWNELNGIMMAMELPGIYLRTDKDEMVVFDHVTVKAVRRDSTGITLDITNPTKFNADVSVFAENAEQAKKTLGNTAFIKWPKVAVPAGKTIRVQVAKDFQVEVIN